MVDSSAFNDIIKSFCKKALENSSVSEQSAQDVINELSNLFNFSCEKSAITNKRRSILWQQK